MLRCTYIHAHIHTRIHAQERFIQESKSSKRARHSTRHLQALQDVAQTQTQTQTQTQAQAQTSVKDNQVASDQNEPHAVRGRAFRRLQHDQTHRAHANKHNNNKQHPRERPSGPRNQHTHDESTGPRSLNGKAQEHDEEHAGPRNQRTYDDRRNDPAYQKLANTLFLEAGMPKASDDVKDATLGFVFMEYRHDSCNILGDLRCVYVFVCVCV
jgi:hypothetical protein